VTHAGSCRERFRQEAVEDCGEVGERCRVGHVEGEGGVVREGEERRAARLEAEQEVRITDWASLERKLRQDEAMEEFEAAAEEMEAAKRKKAKDANKIYKKACTESGKSFCFFSNFTSWQDFVVGRIGDDELYHRAVEEVRKLADAPQQ